MHMLPRHSTEMAMMLRFTVLNVVCAHMVHVRGPA